MSRSPAEHEAEQRGASALSDGAVPAEGGPLTASSPLALAGIIAGAYLLGGGLWILLSDRVLAGLLPRNESTEFVTRLQTFKGWFFVGATGLLLYALVLWGARRLRAGQRAVERSEALFRGVVESNAVAISVYHH